MFTQVSRVLLGLASAAAVTNAEDVLGVFIFHRHGDRTARTGQPVMLSAIGANQAHSSGTFYRDRYVISGADFQVRGLSPEMADLSQLSVTSPAEPVIQTSAQAFLQGLYPPTYTSDFLGDCTEVEAPLNGYQYIPVDAVKNAATSKDGCPSAQTSSQSYFSSPQYLSMLSQTSKFYDRLAPVVGTSMSKDEVNFRNAYKVFDSINAARIHNSSISFQDRLTDDNLDKLFHYASTQQWNLAFNESDPARAITGSVLGGQIVDSLGAIVDGERDAPLMNIQFGAHDILMSFFGLSNLTKASPEFYGISNCASSMAFELVTNAIGPPKPENVGVRFLFSNGTASENELTAFPLFGQKPTLLPWSDFKRKMTKFSINDDQAWCELCGSTDGQCATLRAPGDNNDDKNGPKNDPRNDPKDNSNNGITKTIAGAIGSIVTLAVTAAIESLLMLCGGYRLVNKSRLARLSSPDTSRG